MSPDSDSYCAYSMLQTLLYSICMVTLCCRKYWLSYMWGCYGTEVLSNHQRATLSMWQRIQSQICFFCATCHFPGERPRLLEAADEGWVSPASAHAQPWDLVEIGFPGPLTFWILSSGGGFGNPCFYEELWVILKLTKHLRISDLSHVIWLMETVGQNWNRRGRAERARRVPSKYSFL